MAAPDIQTTELTPKLWPALEQLFGRNGACGGCWCMFWRIPEGERYDDVRGPEAKRRFKALVESGEAKGVLAFVDGVPVGWATYGPRRAFPRLDRAPSFKCDDSDAVASVPCFFIHRDWRGQGVATVLLAAVEVALRREGHRTLEAYPVKPPAGGGRISNGSAYTGTLPFFLKRGYALAAERPAGKQRVRKALKPAPRKSPRP
ncbi:GNAT family N-acetyltransferase [Corallococcus sp. CA053C]|uniref:GNAT family N-acetyltransferase n=1 Tax=Corallococcus sp. CA053C TaxID=2316732 RepID=UPI000EA39FFE|nr:GNAT family N-acetyltransferase [Corallococcus sp. CA053C]RKG98333.1 GNAT family N-acetyltransferase [Corallococcus sp. CA053C]